jgi:hypothetical protein
VPPGGNGGGVGVGGAPPGGTGGSGTAGVGTGGAAAALLVSALDRGWWRSEGAHTVTNKNTAAGYCGTCVVALPTHAWFVFEIPDFVEDVRSVTLHLEHERYSSPDAVEECEVWDVTTSSTRLRGPGTSEADIYEDLGSGIRYGTFELRRNTVGDVISIELSEDAALALSDARGSSFAVGIRVSTYSGRLDSGDEFIRFSMGTESRVHLLEIALVTE